jgi:hypothetical protein
MPAERVRVRGNHPSVHDYCQPLESDGKASFRPENVIHPHPSKDIGAAVCPEREPTSRMGVWTTYIQGNEVAVFLRTPVS